MLGKVYTSGMHEEYAFDVVYTDDIDPLRSTQARIVYSDVRLGAEKEKWSWAPSTLEFYVGAVRAVNVRWLKSVTLGVEGSFSPFTGGGDYPIARSKNSVLTTNREDISVDEYNNRSRAIGIRLGLGLWQ
jgi:hypothetical protein